MISELVYCLLKNTTYLGTKNDLFGYIFNMLQSVTGDTASNYIFLYRFGPKQGKSAVDHQCDYWNINTSATAECNPVVLVSDACLIKTGASPHGLATQQHLTDLKVTDYHLISTLQHWFMQLTRPKVQIQIPVQTECWYNIIGESTSAKCSYIQSKYISISVWTKAG